MKLQELEIIGLPKRFDIYEIFDELNPVSETLDPDSIKYDSYPLEGGDGRDEQAEMFFKYDESATGVEVVYTRFTQNMRVWLSNLAVEADVKLFADVINTVLKLHPRAKLYDGLSRLPGISPDDVNLMVKERNQYLKRRLKGVKPFAMEGLNAGFSVQPEFLHGTDELDVLMKKLQENFVKAQWDFSEI